MVNIPPAMRCTSPGGLRIAGSPNVTMNVAAAPIPTAAAEMTIQMPSQSIMPIRPIAVSGPKIRNGQLPRCRRSDIASMENDPKSCAPFSQPSVVPIMSPRPMLFR